MQKVSISSLQTQVPKFSLVHKKTFWLSNHFWFQITCITWVSYKNACFLSPYKNADSSLRLTSDPFLVSAVYFWKRFFNIKFLFLSRRLGGKKNHRAEPKPHLPLIIFCSKTSTLLIGFSGEVQNLKFIFNLQFHYPVSLAHSSGPIRPAINSVTWHNRVRSFKRVLIFFEAQDTAKHVKQRLGRTSHSVPHF